MVVVLGVSLTATAQNSETKPAADSLEQQIRTVIQERHDAYLRGDRDVYGRYIDPACAFVSPGGVDTAAQQLSDVRPAMGEKTQIDFDNLKVQDFGSIAIAVYHQVMHHQYGEQSMNVPMQVVDTYRRKEARWVMISHAEVYDLTKRKAAKVDAAVYDAYVGVYEWGPGFVDTVTRAGDKLITMLTGEEKASEYLPLNETTFFVPGDTDDGLTTFVKDGSGKVTQYVYSAHGQEIAAKKVK